MILQNQKKAKRIYYTIAFVILLVIEVFIALFVHDTFIRPYLGDVLVVIVLYMALRIVIPEGGKWIPLCLFLFATFVEFLQFFNLVQILGVEHNPLFRIILGSVFDWKDIFCYGVGCILLGIYEWKINQI